MEPETEEEKSERLRRLVLDICDGRVVTDLHVPEGALGIVFVPLMLMSPEERKKFAMLDIGLVYEYLQEAAPSSINGLPVFFSLRTLGREDAKRVCEGWRLERERRQAVKV